MTQDLQGLLDDYLVWLRDKTSLRNVGEKWVEITTPYLDRHNDCLQIYARREGGGYMLTDDGAIISDLELSGCKLESPKRQELLRVTLNGFGVKLDEKALKVNASAENFALRKHSLVQAMLAVNDLFYLATPMVTGLFYEDVVAWLDENDIRYNAKVKVAGKSGYDHLVDFMIPKSRKQPERILQAINRPSPDSAKLLAFAWVDTREVRPPDSKAYALLNDSEQTVSQPVLEALQAYEVQPVLWSERDQIRETLAA